MPKRIDDNQREIVKGLRAIGASVLSTAKLGKGAPDIICGWRRMNYFFEIKNPKRPPSKRKLNSDQEIFHRTWAGQLNTISTLQEALRTIGVATGEE